MKNCLILKLFAGVLLSLALCSGSCEKDTPGFVFFLDMFPRHYNLAFCRRFQTGHHIEKCGFT